MVGTIIRKNRKKLYNIGDRLGINIVIVKLEAPEETVLQRLTQRMLNPSGNSSADLSVYQKMKQTVQPITRPHFVVDTSKDICKPLKNIIGKIRFQHSAQSTMET